MTWKHVACIAISACGLAGAQVRAQDPPPFARAAFLAERLMQGQPQSGVIGLDPLNVGRPVANAPYSAEAVTEVTQTLADGNRIERRTTALVARDSKGRTRREQSGIALGPFVAKNDQPIVTITDPTTHTHLTLNYEQKLAFRIKPVRVTMNEPPPNEARPRRQASLSASGTGASPAGTTASMPTFTAAVPPPPPDVMVMNEAVAAEPGEVFAGGIAAMRFEGDVKTEKLPPQQIEGIPAEGTKTVMTIPAGAMGNALPIEVVSERWYSPDLDVVLMTRRADPRFGETVYRLTNITRAEPSADLFTVPPDFKVEDVRPGRMLQLRKDDEQEQQ